MTTSSAWSTFLKIVALLTCSLLGASEFEYSLTPAKIQPGERAELRLRVQSDDPEKIKVRDDLLDQFKAIVILNRRTEQGQGWTDYVYEFTTYRSGVTHIPPVEVSVGPKSFSTERTPISVVSTRAEDDNDLRPGFGEVELPFLFPRWAKIAIAAFLFMIPVVWLIRRYWPKRKQKPVVVAPVPKEDPFDWIRRELIRLRHGLERQNNEDWVDDFANTLRLFVRKAKDTPAQAFTTQEVAEVIPGEVKGLVPILEEFDRFKFMPEKPDSPNWFHDRLKQTEEVFAAC